MPDFLPEFTASASFAGNASGQLVFGAVPGAGMSATLTPFFKGERGEQGASGSTSPPTPFAFGDASPRTLFTTVAASLVLAVSVNITAPFNGAAPSLRIGTAGQSELLVAAAQLDLSVATEFEFSPNVVLGSAQGVVLTLVPGAGATQGAGWIVIEQIPST